jgi:hypothetical protein
MAAARRDWRQGIGEIIGRSGELVIEIISIKIGHLTAFQAKMARL